MILLNSGKPNENLTIIFDNSEIKINHIFQTVGTTFCRYVSNFKEQVRNYFHVGHGYVYADKGLEINIKNNILQIKASADNNDLWVVFIYGLDNDEKKDLLLKLRDFSES